MSAQRPVTPGLYGRGRPNTLYPTKPAAGADWVFRPNVGATWRLIGGAAKLVTSAQAANRVPVFLMDDGTTELWAVPSNNNQTAGTTVTYELIPGTGVTTLGAGRQVIPLPDGLLFDYRYRILSSTVAIDAGDQWSSIALFVEEWADFPQ